jgi:hypothetical protein
MNKQIHVGSKVKHFKGYWKKMAKLALGKFYKSLK